MENVGNVHRRKFLEITACTALTAPMAAGNAMSFSEPGPVFRSNCLLGERSEVSISPCEGWRDRTSDYCITIKLGRGGLAAGDSIGIVNGSLMDRWQFTFPSHHWGARQPWQSTIPDTPNYISATCDRAGVELDVKLRQPLPKGHDNRPSHFVTALRNRKRSVLEISPRGGSKEGDVIEIQWRNVKAPSYAMCYLFLPFVFSRLPRLDRDLPIKRGEFDDLPRIRIKGHTAASLHVTCRPLQGVGEKFFLNVAAIDQYGNPQTAGLQATYASELSRRGLYQGMKNRRTYGTSGARIVLLFRCGLSQMGSQVKMRAGEKPEFEIEVGGTDSLSEIALCRYDGATWSEPFQRSPHGQDRWAGRWQDDGFAASGIYYVRVTQTDGEQAWSSPIWVL